VHSQAYTEDADLRHERAELEADNNGQHRQLMAIYVRRGLDAKLAKQVADQLMAHDALGAHARDELGITPAFAARPLQAAGASAVSFALGASLPVLVVAFVRWATVTLVVAGTTLAFLALLGALAARAGGARMRVGATRVAFWGALAMAVTFGVGALFGTVR